MEVKKGFTLIELILVIAILGILGSIALFITYPTYDKIRFQITINKMDQLVRAIIGDERIINTGERVDFGYAGDTNQLPSSLSDLVTNPGIPGWKGPYIQREFPSEDPEGYRKDGWGNYFIYSKSNGTITSYGSDGVPGGSGYAADITRYIYQPMSSLNTNILRVYVKDRNNNTLTNVHVTVTITLPSGSINLGYNSFGYFEIYSMWLGNYEVTVTPTPPYSSILGPPLVTTASVYPKGNSSYSSIIVKFPNPLPFVSLPIEITFLSSGANITYFTQWTNMPSALTELFGITHYRKYYDLSNANQVRLLVSVVVAGTTTSLLRCQYSIDQINWYYLDGVSGPEVSIRAVGLIVSNWVNLTQNAKQNVYLRIVGLGGDGTADPRFTNIFLQIR